MCLGDASGVHLAIGLDQPVTKPLRQRRDRSYSFQNRLLLANQPPQHSIDELGEPPVTRIAVSLLDRQVNNGMIGHIEIQYLGRGNDKHMMKRPGPFRKGRINKRGDSSFDTWQMAQRRQQDRPCQRAIGVVQNPVGGVPVKRIENTVE